MVQPNMREVMMLVLLALEVPGSQEYRRLMAKAQRNWAAYRQRMSQPNLYSRTRGWSTCYLETNLDTGVRDLASTHRQVLLFSESTPSYYHLAQTTESQAFSL